MVKRRAEEKEEEEGEETKAEENLSPLMSKNDKDQENRLINLRCDVITVKNSIILQMNTKTRRNQECVKRRRI